MKLLEKIRAAKAGKSFGARLAITLVELTLVLALAAIVVFVVVRAYSTAQENSRVQQAASTVGQIRSVVESLAQGQASYAFLGADTAAATGAISASLPSSFVSGGNLVQPFGTIDIAQTGSDYTVTLNSLPADACQRLAVMDMGRSVSAVKAGSTAIDLTSATAAATAATACAAGGVAVAWTFQ